MDRPLDSESRRSALLERALPWLVQAAATIVYLLTLQRRLYNDGIFFEDKLRIGGEQLLYNHILYLPLVKSFQLAVSLVHPIDAEQAMKIGAALIGGAGVALTFFVARACRLTLGQSSGAAVLLAVLVGYWFHSTATELHGLHAACATLFLLGLVRVLSERRIERTSTIALLIFGAALTPASHVSGICALLPLAYVFMRVPGARRGLALWTGAGLLVFAAAYFWILSRDAGFAGYTAVHTDKHSVLWQAPGRVPGLLAACLAELSLYSAPAAALVPAGLVVLFRKRSELAWLSASWLIAWPIIAWPVADRAVGSYYIPTYPVQVLLAVMAIRALGTTAVRAVVSVVLATLPTIAFIWSRHLFAWFPALGTSITGETLGLIVLVLCAIVLLWLLRRPEASGSGLGIWLMPVAAAVISAPHIILNVMDLDLRRDRVRAVAEVVERADREAEQSSLVVFLATETVDNHHWKHFFPGAYRDYEERRVFNPVEVAFEPDPSRVEPRLTRYRAKIEDALAAGRPVFLAGSLVTVEALLRVTPGDHSRLREFLVSLQARHELAPTGVADLWQIRIRDR